MKNIVLIGMMGSGKTTCARILSRKLGRKMVDTDDLLTERAGKSIPQIFAEDGEAAFRAMETAIARELGGSSDLIIATGGGMVLRAENAAALRQNSWVVYLDRDAREIFRHTDMSGRPLAQQGEDAFAALAAERDHVYRACADIVVQNSRSAQDAAAQILKAWEELQ